MTLHAKLHLHATSCRPYGAKNDEFDPGVTEILSPALRAMQQWSYSNSYTIAEKETALLPTALAREVMQSPPSVRLSVRPFVSTLHCVHKKRPPYF